VRPSTLLRLVRVFDSWTVSQFFSEQILPFPTAYDNAL
jgi:hypothetical protein